ncbi:unnamed protein product [Cuscuta europaea]|uniref:Uncharacterized protein n=1 Tax=Cuscuta europaea TaxID=41803 RepID=A0A9P0Z2Y1_CUSEU|nr:unnamed protein product [Cuscuta europaea]
METMMLLEEKCISFCKKYQCKILE